VRLRAAQIHGCAFRREMHSTDARNAGEDERRLATLSAWREAPCFSERERAALQWAEAVMVGQEQVSDGVWSSVHGHFTPEELTDLALLSFAINGWNRFAIGVGKMHSRVTPAPWGAKERASGLRTDDCSNKQVAGGMRCDQVLSYGRRLDRSRQGRSGAVQHWMATAWRRHWKY
jgi:AhpD family alkylhydroperoxidase